MHSSVGVLHVLGLMLWSTRIIIYIYRSNLTFTYHQVCEVCDAVMPIKLYSISSSRDPSSDCPNSCSNGVCITEVRALYTLAPTHPFGRRCDWQGSNTILLDVPPWTILGAPDELSPSEDWPWNLYRDDNDQTTPTTCDAWYSHWTSNQNGRGLGGR